jgi:Fe-S-cluster-containing hydrogenase component 2
MGKKLLIDLEKLRDLNNIPVEGIFKQDEYAASFKTIRELATFQFTCRKCEKAPCVAACPVEALEKAGNNIVRRAMLLCIRCKSCVFICPFGTMMDNLFEVKTSGRRFIHLDCEKDLQMFAESFPDDVISIVDRDENPAENIFRLSDDILIKEHTWQ